MHTKFQLCCFFITFVSSSRNISIINIGNQLTNFQNFLAPKCCDILSASDKYLWISSATDILNSDIATCNHIHHTNEILRTLDNHFEVLFKFSVEALYIETIHQNTNKNYQLDSCLNFLQSQSIVVFLESETLITSEDLIKKKKLLINIISILPKHKRPLFLSVSSNIDDSSVWLQSLINSFQNPDDSGEIIEINNDDSKVFPSYVKFDEDIASAMRKVATQYHNYNNTNDISNRSSHSYDQCKFTFEDKLILNKIKIANHHQNNDHHNRNNSIYNDRSDNSNNSYTIHDKRLLCITYTISPNHDRIKDIIHTWGHKCDGYLAFSNFTNLTISTYGIMPYSNWIDSYNNMWKKIQFIFETISSILINDYDYFLIGGDDLFMIVENLKALLNTPYFIHTLSHNGTKPIFLGRLIHQNEYLNFLSGGSGYILNRIAVHRFQRYIHNDVSSYDKNKNNINESSDNMKATDTISMKASGGYVTGVDASTVCLPTVQTSMEDVLVAHCLLHAGIEPVSAQHISLAMRQVIQANKNNNNNNNNNNSYTIEKSKRSGCGLVGNDDDDDDVDVNDMMRDDVNVCAEYENSTYNGFRDSDISITCNNNNNKSNNNYDNNNNWYMPHQSEDNKQLHQPPPLDDAAAVEEEDIFHPIDPKNAYQGGVNTDWYSRMVASYKSGMECCSAYSVSFHYIRPPDYNMKCVYRSIYHKDFD